MRKKLLLILIILCFSIQTCFGALVTVIEKDITYTFTKTAGNTVTLEAKDPAIQGWAVTKGDVVLDENNSFIMPSKDVTVEALYSAQTEFSLIVNQFGTVTSEYVTAGEEVTITADPGNKFVFLGWSATGLTLSASQQTSATITFEMPNNTVRLETIHEKNEHTLTVNPGGATYTGLEDDTISIVAPTQTGYTVTYNNNYTGATTTTVTANKEFNNWTLAGSGSISNYNDSMTSYTYGNGDGTLTANYATQSITLPSPTRGGYTLLGWSTNSGATSATYNAGASYVPTQNITLYAIWSINTYTVTFDPNGGTGTMAAQAFTYGVPQNLTINTFTKSGHSFVGWSEIQGGTLKYLDGASYTATGDATLYAIWETNACTITFDANGGTGTMATQGFNYGATKNLLPNAFVKEGYTFKGWSTTTNGAVEYANGASYTAAGDATLYAVWEINTYTVTFDANGGNGTMLPQSFTYGIAQNLTLNTFTKEGHTFKGWSTTAAGSVSCLDGSSYTATGSVTLYAVWETNKYIVTFNKNDGSGATYTQIFTHGVVQNLTTNGFTREGYTFKGWSLTAGGAVEYTDGASYTATGAVTLYAVWEINTYTVTFDANGGIGTMTPQTFTHGVAQNLNLNSYTKENYNFVGWALTAEESPIYADGGSCIATGNITLYAIWQLSTYTVTFDANGGTGTMDPQVFEYGVAQNLTVNGYSRENYCFTGWSTTAGGTVEYTNRASYTATANITLYAIWKPVYVITAITHEGSIIEGVYTNKVCSACGGTNHECEVVNVFIDAENSDILGEDDEVIDTREPIMELSEVLVGAYIEYVPTANTASISDEFTGVEGTGAQTFTIDKNDATKMKWRVFKNNSGQIDIISENSVGDLTLNSLTGYENAVYSLNTLSNQYQKDGYTFRARSLGSTEEWNETAIEEGKSVGQITLLTSSVGEFPDTDELYSDDLNIMNNQLELLDSENSIWLASREAYRESGAIVADVRVLETDGSLGYREMYFGPYDNEEAWLYGEGGSYANGVRPVVSLNTSIKVVDGLGTAEDPYIIAKVVEENTAAYEITGDLISSIVWDTSYGTSDDNGQSYDYQSTTLTLYNPNDLSETAEFICEWGVMPDISSYAEWIFGVNGSYYLTTERSELDCYDENGGPDGVDVFFTISNVYPIQMQEGLPVYTVTFNPNGGTGTMDAQEFTMGLAQSLSLNTFTKSGHSFAGWTTTPNGTRKYFDCANYTATANVTLYAVWEANESPILATANGQWYDQGGTSIDRSSITNITLADTYTPGTILDSWDASKGQVGTITAYVEDDGSGNGTYKVTLVGNGTGSIIADVNCTGGFAEFDSLTSFSGLDILDTSNVSTMEYMFGNCARLESLNLGSFDTENVETTAGMFYYCLILSKIYVSDLWDMSSVTESSDMFSECRYLEGGNGTAISSKGVYDKTYAVIDKSGQEGYLTSNTYTVTFDSNGGTGTMEPQTFTVGVEESLNTNAFAREGYSFSGWHVSGIDDPIADGGIYAGTTDATLYATWTRIYYQMSFNNNGGSGVMSTASVAAGSSYTLPTCTFNSPSVNYKFNRWLTKNSDGTTSALYSAGTTFTPTANTTFYASWIRSDLTGM